MIKKHMTSLIFCLLMVIIMPVQAMTANTDNTNKKCSLSISFIIGDLKAEDVEFKIYRIADIAESNNFSITKKFKSYPISQEDFTDYDRWRNLAQTLSGYAVADKLQADSVAKTTAEGIAYFSELPTGLYLIVGSQYIAEGKTYTPQSFIISMPTKDNDGVWQYDLTVGVKFDSTENDENFELKIIKIWHDGSNPNRP